MATQLLCVWARCLHCGAVRRARPLCTPECCDDPMVLSVSIETPQEQPA